MNYSGINLETLQNRDFILLLENNIRGGISSFIDIYAKSDEKKKILYIDATNLYGWAMSEYLPYDENIFSKKFKLEDFLSTPDDSDFGDFLDVDIKKSGSLKKKKTKNFPFAPENKKS